MSDTEQYPSKGPTERSEGGSGEGGKGEGVGRDPSRWTWVEMTDGTWLGYDPEDVLWYLKPI